MVASGGVTERWQRFVEGGLQQSGGRLAAARDAWGYMAPVLDRIRARLPVGSRIIELGCGAALHASLLASWGYRLTVTDNDPQIVELARETSAEFAQAMEILQVDATEIPGHFRGYDLIYSLGLVEHFDRDVTVELLRQQSQVASEVMAVVPSRHTRLVATVTDERLYPLSSWKAMFRDAGLTVDDAFVFGDVPTLLGAGFRRVLPPPVYRAIQRWYGMSFCIFGRSDATSN